MGVGVEKEALQPAALAGDRARGLLQPFFRVAAEGGFECFVAPFDPAMFIDEGDGSLEVSGDDVLSFAFIVAP